MDRAPTGQYEAAAAPLFSNQVSWGRWWPRIGSAGCVQSASTSAIHECGLEQVEAHQPMLHSSRYLLSTYCVPGTALSIANTAVDSEQNRHILMELTH